MLCIVDVLFVGLECGCIDNSAHQVSEIGYIANFNLLNLCQHTLFNLRQMLAGTNAREAAEHFCP